jgi:ABC-type multidrug transport system fused ATPase/permease subunit
MISPFLTLVSLSIFPLLTFILTKISVSIRRKSKQGQAQLSILGSMFEESISGLRIIKGFNAIDYFIQKFKVVNQSYTRLINKVNRKVELASPLSEVLCTLSLCFVIGIGGYLLFTQKGHLRADTLILFVLVFARLIPPLQAGVRSFNLMQKALVSARRVFELMDADEVVEEKMNALPIKHFEHNITFKDVSFAYDSSKGVLHHINLTIEKGQSLALVGMSGAGKTTLLNLLPRFYDVSQGEILLDGVNIKDYVISDLRALMGLVSQDILLFNDTVYNNICFGLENVSEKQVYEAAKIANADEFISAMPQAYQTNIGDRGVKLSGGQRQRLSIARAVLRNPEILLFDEATSALDSQSEVMVQEAIENVMRNRTSVMIAHRLTSVQNADRILVFQEGNVVEEGSHHQLIQQNGMYAKWVEMQQVNG